MTVWTVECGCAAYDYAVVVVEADTLDEALTKAVEGAGDSSDWTSRDQCGPVHVDAVAPGRDVRPWRNGRSVLPIPDRFTEDGEPPLVVVVMDGGAIHDVTFEGRPCRVLIRDYDVESGEPEDCEPDPEGRPALTFRYGPWPDPAPDPDPEIPAADPGGG